MFETMDTRFFFDLGIRHAAAGLIPDRNVARADPGYIVCRCPRPVKLSESVTAIPWSLL